MGVGSARNRCSARWAARQVCYTLDVAQYAMGAGPETNFFYAINKALQKRDPSILLQLTGSGSLSPLCQPPIPAIPIRAPPIACP